MPIFVWCSGKIDWWIRDAGPEAAVRSASMVMCKPVFCNDAQVRFCQRNEKVKAFSAERTDHPFTEAVSLWISRRCSEDSKPHVSHGPVELRRENAIADMDEKTVGDVVQTSGSKFALFVESELFPEE
jgi:hypothetical protein